MTFSWVLDKFLYAVPFTSRIRPFHQHHALKMTSISHLQYSSAQRYRHLWLHCWPSHYDIILLPGVLEPHMFAMNILIYVGSSTQSVWTVKKFIVRPIRQGNDVAGDST